jgi:hypothetical protein
VQDPVPLDLLAQACGERAGVQRHGRPTQAADGGVGAGQREHPAARTAAAGQPAFQVRQRVRAGRLHQRLAEHDAGGLGGRDAFEGEPPHGGQAVEVHAGVAPVGSRHVLARTQAVAPVPGAQGPRSDTQPARDGGDRQPCRLRQRGRCRGRARSAHP